MSVNSSRLVRVDYSKLTVDDKQSSLETCVHAYISKNFPPSASGKYRILDICAGSGDMSKWIMKMLPFSEFDLEWVDIQNNFDSFDIDAENITIRTRLKDLNERQALDDLPRDSFDLAVTNPPWEKTHLFTKNLAQFLKDSCYLFVLTSRLAANTLMIPDLIEVKSFNVGKNCFVDV